MKFVAPIEFFTFKNSVTQLFGVNAPLYQKNFGIPGHNGIDVRIYYGQHIKAMHNGTVTKIIYDNPHNTKGNGVYLLSEDRTLTTIYWHLSQFLCNVGDELQAGQVLGLGGNSGFVRPKPTKESPKAGTHLHIGVKLHGHSNDYKGFVDPLPYLYNEGDKLPVKFERDMFIGSSGDDVSWLQSLLRLEGFAEDYDPIAWYGNKTRRDVRKLQIKYGLSPTLGYCGTKTRHLLNSKYS